MEVRLVGAELFLTDGQTDTTKLIVAFLNFANAPKIIYLHVLRHCSASFSVGNKVKHKN
jgi:hypothetical protein